MAAAVHDRVPVVLTGDALVRWLALDTEVASLPMLRRACLDDALQVWPVARRAPLRGGTPAPPSGAEAPEARARGNVPEGHLLGAGVPAGVSHYGSDEGSRGDGREADDVGAPQRLQRIGNSRWPKQ